MSPNSMARMARSPRGDRDHRVSLREYQDWLSYAFDAMDRNHDGRITASELQNWR